MSLTQLSGIEEIIGEKVDGTPGAMSGACKLFKDSLDTEIRSHLNRYGVVIIPVPYNVKQQIEMDLNLKACQQYNLMDFSDNVILLDTGHAKLMAAYFPLEYLKQIPGFEGVRIYDPYAGGIGNSIRFCAMAPRNNAMKVVGVNNLYCAGEKAGLLVGHTEAIATGVLAGHNAARFISGQKDTILPTSLAVGDIITFSNKESNTREGRRKKYTFSGSIYFDRMKKLGLYTIDRKEISERVYKSGCFGIFGTPKYFN